MEQIESWSVEILQNPYCRQRKYSNDELDELVLDIKMLKKIDKKLIKNSKTKK